MYLISEVVSIALRTDVGDVDHDAPRADVDVHAQVEQLARRHHQPVVVLLRVHLHRELVPATHFQHR